MCNVLERTCHIFSTKKKIEKFDKVRKLSVLVVTLSNVTTPYAHEQNVKRNDHQINEWMNDIIHNHNSHRDQRIDDHCQHYQLTNGLGLFFIHIIIHFIWSKILKVFHSWQLSIYIYWIRLYEQMGECYYNGSIIKLKCNYISTNMGRKEKNKPLDSFIAKSADNQISIDQLCFQKVTKIGYTQK